jgi:hypothetical protein
MKVISLIVFLFLSSIIKAQYVQSIKNINVLSKDRINIIKYTCVTDKRIKKTIEGGNVSGRFVLKNKLRKIDLFFLVENLVNELLKPGPIVNDAGFHFKANPYLEIPETMGDTEYMKFGIKFYF